MPATIEELRGSIEREERSVGLRADGEVSPLAVQRRRLQMVFISVLVVLGLVATTVADDLWRGFSHDTHWVSPQLVRIAMIAFASLFVAYLAEKDHHLKRLERLGVEVHALDVQLAERLLDDALLADVRRSVDETLDLDEVLDRTLAHACRRTGARAGTVCLLAAEGDLREAARAGDEPAAELLPETIQLRVALAREPVMLTGPGAVLCAPVTNDDEVLGVITLAPAVGEGFDATDVAALERLVACVAPAISNARRYEAARVRLDAAEQERIVQVQEELRTLAIDVRDVIAALRYTDIDAMRRIKLLDVLDERASAMLAVIE